MSKDLASLRVMTGALIRAARRYRLAADAQLQALGLSDATALPVLYLRRLGDGVRQGVLADELGVEGPSLVRVLDQLEAQNLVTRVPDAGDRRVRLLKLTASGRKLAIRAEAALDLMREDLFAGLSEGQTDSTRFVLEHLAEALQQREAEMADGDGRP